MWAIKEALIPFQVEATKLKLFLPPFWKGVYSKSKDLAPSVYSKSKDLLPKEFAPSSWPLFRRVLVCRKEEIHRICLIL